MASHHKSIRPNARVRDLERYERNLKIGSCTVTTYYQFTHGREKNYVKRRILLSERTGREYFIERDINPSAGTEHVPEGLLGVWLATYRERDGTRKHVVIKEQNSDRRPLKEVAMMRYMADANGGKSPRGCLGMIEVMEDKVKKGVIFLVLPFVDNVGLLVCSDLPSTGWVTDALVPRLPPPLAG
jgi:hypothetical protein